MSDGSLSSLIGLSTGLSGRLFFMSGSLYWAYIFGLLPRLLDGVSAAF